jgi:hypothetical protein
MIHVHDLYKAAFIKPLAQPGSGDHYLPDTFSKSHQNFLNILITIHKCVFPGDPVSDRPDRVGRRDHDPSR